MLFFLGKELQDALSGSGDGELKYALENITLAHNEGKHLLSGSRAELLAASTLPGLSARASATLKQVVETLPEYGGLRQAVKFFVEITPPGREIAGEARRIQLPWTRFLDSESIQSSIILAENRSDAKLYVKVAETYAARNDLGSLKVSAEVRGGGGSTISQEYIQIQTTDRRLCYCLADSDRRFPGDRLGDTAKTLQEANDPAQCGSMIRLLEVREAENLLPPALLLELDNLEPRAVRTIDVLQRAPQALADFLARYADIKRGLTVHEAVAEISTSFPLNLSDLWRYGSEVAPGCRARARCGNEQNCSCFIVAGLGNHVLSRTLQILERRTPHKVAECLNGCLVDLWTELGHEIFSWCCALKPTRVI